jgi:hypothetical protein
MGRILFLALPALAGCDVLIEEGVDACVDAVFIADHGIEVKNAGIWEARMTVVYDEDAEGFTDTTYLNPGEKQTVWYDDAAMTVTIERILDGQILYQDHLSRPDFRREHDRVEITVYP